MEVVSLERELRSNSYPGRGIVIGRTRDGAKAVAAYFIMGRSQNSRNRIFAADGEGIRTQAFDESKMEDPSLIIYAPVRVLGNQTIVTNGDQTDTIYEGILSGKTFEQSLRCREFEPDAPNYTPRISGILQIENGHFSYAMSILKSADGNPEACSRYTFTYDSAVAGEGRFIHTYLGDVQADSDCAAQGAAGTAGGASVPGVQIAAGRGNGGLPSFEGEPKRVGIPDDIETCTDLLWGSLNEDNKVSLFVRYIDIETGSCETRIRNKNQ
ncbi:MAG: IMP cyclohydrolase [Lachnospiraceae bacterium]|nr:IMP cyclohydrolase [Lachnospiraceae bacterium]